MCAQEDDPVPLHTSVPILKLSGVLMHWSNENPSLSVGITQELSGYPLEDPIGYLQLTHGLSRKNAE